jgi:predicted transcriptional regulator
VTLQEIKDALQLRIHGPEADLHRNVQHVYVSDLLSDVLAHAEDGALWITLQCHPNIVAVAVMKELSGIILINGRVPEDETLQKAEEEGIPIMSTEMPAFILAGRLYQMLGM